MTPKSFVSYESLSQSLGLQANTGLIITFAPFSYTKQAYKDLQNTLAQQPYNTNIDFIIFQTYDTSISMSQWSPTWTALQQCKVMVACEVTAVVMADVLHGGTCHIVHATACLQGLCTSPALLYLLLVPPA